MLCSLGTATADSLFVVKQYRFCRNVANLVPVGPYENPTDIENDESLWIWMEISVNQNGYLFLRRLGKLPVYVTWGKDGWLAGKTIDIGITRAQWETNRQQIAWRMETSTDSTFTWRTYAVRESLATGEYYVSVLDANREPVTTSNDAISSFRPKITLKAVRR